MIYKFKITTVEKPDFLLQVVLDARHTFADLHYCIQEACGYSKSQLASFFLPGNYREKQLEVTQLNPGFAVSSKYIMSRTQLKSLVKSLHQRWLYEFDFFQGRSLNIELTHIVMRKTLLRPSITSNDGKAPIQILEEEIQNQVYESAAMDEKYDYGDVDDYTEIYGEMEDLQGGS